MAATLDTALSVFSGNSIPRQCSQYFLTHKPTLSINFQLSITAAASSVSQRFPRSSSLAAAPSIARNRSKLCFELCFSVQEVDLEAAPENTEAAPENTEAAPENTEAASENTEAALEKTEVPIKRKLFVQNLPWTFSVVDIKNLFAECGPVKDVEIIRKKDGRSRGYAFVIMAEGEAAQAVVDKFDSYEISGRIIRVEFAKRFRKPSPTPPPPLPLASETRYKLYIANLAWKARSTHLREFFSENFNPVSSRVVFDNPTGRSAGYGFVSFATREEAESALSALDGKELMGRPVRLKMSEKNASVSETGNEEEEKEEGEVKEEEVATDQAQDS